MSRRDKKAKVGPGPDVRDHFMIISFQAKAFFLLNNYHMVIANPALCTYYLPTADDHHDSRPLIKSCKSQSFVLAFYWVAPMLPY
jgi:hypothetical protein